MKDVSLVATALIGMKHILMFSKMIEKPKPFRWELLRVGNSRKLKEFMLENFLESQGDGLYRLKSDALRRYQELASEYWEKLEPFERKFLAGKKHKEVVEELKKSKEELEREIGIYSVLEKDVPAYDRETRRIENAKKWLRIHKKQLENHPEKEDLKKKIDLIKQFLSRYKEFSNNIGYKIAILAVRDGVEIKEPSSYITDVDTDIDGERISGWKDYVVYKTIAGNKIVLKKYQYKRCELAVKEIFTCPVLPKMDYHEQATKNRTILDIQGRYVPLGHIKLLVGPFAGVFVDTGCPAITPSLRRRWLDRGMCGVCEYWGREGCGRLRLSIEMKREDFEARIKEVLKLGEEEKTSQTPTTAEVNLEKLNGEMVKFTVDVSKGNHISFRRIRELLKKVQEG